MITSIPMMNDEIGNSLLDKFTKNYRTSTKRLGNITTSL